MGTNEFRLGVTLALTFILNILDGVFTLVWINCKIATEANPIMASLIEYPLLFMGVKTVLVGLGAMLMWRLRSNKLSVIGAVVCLVAYTLVFCYHMMIFDESCDISGEAHKIVLMDSKQC